jgi:protein SDA1
MDLLQLQSNVKRDPVAYRDEFLQQQRHFVAELQVFLLKPSKEYKQFAMLVNFLAQVASCYPQDLQQFPTQLANLLEQHGHILEPELRKILVQCLILLRNRNVITASSLLTLFFKLFRIKDKKLRAVLYHHIVSDIRRLNSKKRDEKVNRALQNFMYTMLQDSTKIAARKSLEVMIELYNTGVWRETKTVNVISTAIFSSDTKMVLSVINFFLKPVGENDDATEDKEFRYDKREIIKKFGHGVVRKTTKKKRKLKEAMSELNQKRKHQLKHRMDDRRNYNYSAIMLLNDPQGYAEKVYRVLTKSSDRFEAKVMLMALLSRLIASHQLMLLDFYSYIQKYLAPHQQHITNLMAITAQACHPLVTPEALDPIVKTIAFNFVSDRRTNEAIVVGLNTIREICLRCPLVMTEPLLHDLLEYRHNHDKGISMAAKSLLALFRLLDPQMLPRKLRGKSDNIGTKEEFGAQSVTKQLEGTELLEQYRAGLIDVDLASEDDFSEISGEWVDVSDGDDDFNIAVSDSDQSEAGSDAFSGDEAMDVDDNGAPSKRRSKAPKASSSNSTDLQDEEAYDANDGWETASDDPEEFMEMVKAGEAASDASGLSDMDVDGEDMSGSMSDEESGEEGEWIEVTDSEEDGEAGSDDEEESGEWVTASEDEDDEEHVIDEEARSRDESETQGEGQSTTASERLEAVQVLTDEDFALIAKLKKAKADGKLEEVIAVERKKGKRAHDFISKIQDMRDEDIDLAAIEGFQKKAKLDKEGRKAVLKENREERLAGLDKSRQVKKTKSKTNEAKAKSKPFMMVKNSSRVQRKKTRSMSDAMAVRGKHIKKFKTMDKSFKAKILRK